MVLLFAVVVLSSACGSGSPLAADGGGGGGGPVLAGDADPIPAGAADGGPGGGRNAARWFDGALGVDDSQVRLTFYARDAAGGEHCEQWLRPEIRSDQDELELILVTYVADNPAWADATPEERDRCEHREHTLTVDLGEPLGDRLLVQIGGDTEMRIEDEQLRIVPESRPCGRVDCNSPSPTPASCDEDAQRQAIEEVDGGRLGGSQARCDGSFLIVVASVGGGGCLADESGANPCARSNRAFFVARDGQWSLVTYGSPEFASCDDVLWSSGIRFPDELCPS